MYSMVLLFSLLITNYTSNAYKALVVTQMNCKSHAILNDAIVKQLLKEGNEVTYIRTIPYENPPPNLREIDLSSNYQVIPASVLNLNSIINKTVKVNDHYTVKHRMTAISIRTIENKDVQKLLNDTNEHFDVVIAEFICNDLLAGFAAVFDCPMIWFSPTEANSDILRKIDGVSPACIPDFMSRNIAPFTFQQRLQELWSRIKSQYLYYMYIYDIQIEAYNRLIAPSVLKRGREPPSLYDIFYNVSLVLGYSHVSWGDAIRLPQSYKSVGGFHIEEDNKPPLPEDLKEILDKSINGVIYFSMGSNLKSKEWPEETKISLLKMLGEFKQTVLWKFEDTLPSTPKNIYISNWFPQLSILSHPNCVLFITHGGLLSIAEAVHFGVPIIGIPAFADQFVNIERAAFKGFGLKVDLTTNIMDNLKIAITEIISNPSFKNKAKELSFIYHDRPIKPIVEMSHWVRHVVRTRGARHLRSTDLDLPLHQRLYLDLAALIFVILVFMFISCRLVYRICLKKCMQKQISRRKKEY